MVADDLRSMLASILVVSVVVDDRFEPLILESDIFELINTEFFSIEFRAVVLVTLLSENDEEKASELFSKVFEQFFMAVES